jgi:hypothetical protein
MKSNLEARLRRLEGRASQGADSILVVEKLGDEKAYEIFQRGFVKTVIATGVPRGDGYFRTDPAHKVSK